jgi:predicted amidohydrolase YtcJ
MTQVGHWGAVAAIALLVPGCRARDGIPAPTEAPVPGPALPVAPELVQDPAETIFTHGIVLTLESPSPAQALAVRRDRIVAVGTHDEVLAWRGPSTQVIDLRGHVLMPGFIDAHTHIFNDAWMWGLDLEGAQQLALENGITTLGDLYVTPEFLEEMLAFEAQGRLRVRTSLYLVHADNCGNILGDWFKAHPATDIPGEMLRIGGVKIFADGGSCGHPALSYESSWGPSGGDLWHSPEALSVLVRDAHDSGYQVAIHALGDRALDAALQAIAASLAGGPNPLRHRIEHNAVVRPDQLGRHGELGLVATLFGAYPVCGGFAPPEAYQTWEWPWRALIDANPGAHFAWHGDDPWVGPVSPLLELYGLVTRRQVTEDGSVCQPPSWMGDDLLGRAEALELMTRGSAFALFREDEVGALRSGLFADLVLLSGNPLAGDPDAIPGIEIWMTMVGGRAEYCAPGHEAFCPGPAPSSSTTASLSARASATVLGSPPESAIDGDPETIWSAGIHPPQWLEIDLGMLTAVRGLRLTVSQYPEGETLHRLWGAGDGGELQPLHEFHGWTADGDLLEVLPADAWTGLRRIRIETILGPSWVAWREIEILTAPWGLPAANGHTGGHGPSHPIDAGELMLLATQL